MNRKERRAARAAQARRDTKLKAAMLDRGIPGAAGWLSSPTRRFTTAPGGPRIGGEGYKMTNAITRDEAIRRLRVDYSDAEAIVAQLVSLELEDAGALPGGSLP